MLRRMVEQSGRPLSFSLVQSPLRAGGNGGWRQLLDLLEGARADGLADHRPGRRPWHRHPARAPVHAPPVPGQPRLRRDRRPPARRPGPGHGRPRPADAGARGRPRTQRHRRPQPVPGLGAGVRARRPARLRAARRRRASPPAPRPTAASSRPPSPTTSWPPGGGEGLLYSPIFNYADGDLGAVREMLTHPHAVVGLADGGAHVGTICDASFPTTLLAHWGRDRAEGQLPAAVPRPAPDPRHGAHRRAGRPRRPRAGLPGRRQPHRPRSSRRPAARRPARPPRRRHAVRAGGRRLRGDGRRRRGDLRSRARRPVPCPAVSSAAPRPLRTERPR